MRIALLGCAALLAAVAAGAAQAGRGVDLVVVGATLANRFEGCPGLVLAKDGERISETRARVEHGALDGLSPKWVVIASGEHDLAGSPEALADEIGSNYAVRVASSDGLVQLSSFRSGVLRMSARELREEVETARKDMGTYYHK